MNELISGNFAISTVAGLATAVAAGYLGIFMVMRRIALVSDALSHVALPGIALGILLHFNPFLGAFVFLILAALLIVGIEKRTNLPADAIVGVLFSASLALGILLTPQPDILEALFGDFTKLTVIDAWVAVIASLVIVLVTIRISRHLMFSIVAPDLGHASRVHTKFANFLFLTMLAAIVALGIKFVGTLLMGTLTIIPAAAAKNVSKTLFSFGIVSMGFAAASVLLGMGTVYLWHVPAGPAVILASAGIFLITLFVKRP